MKIGLINGDEGLRIKIKDKSVHTKLLYSDSEEKFDILIFNKQVEFIPKKLLRNEGRRKYALVNIDEYKSFAAFNNTFLITYGMNNKACITASSIEKDKIQICLQRNLLALDRKIIEEQEFGIEMKNADRNFYQVMFLVAANILYYAGSDKLSKWF